MLKPSFFEKTENGVEVGLNVGGVDYRLEISDRDASRLLTMMIIDMDERDLRLLDIHLKRELKKHDPS